jgi:hypothetical protein
MFFPHRKTAYFIIAQKTVKIIVLYIVPSFLVLWEEGQVIKFSLNDYDDDDDDYVSELIIHLILL